MRTFEIAQVRRVLAVAGMCIAVFALAAWFAGERGTELRIVPCGIAPGPKPLEIPAAMLRQLERDLPLGIGPIKVSGLAEPIVVRLVGVQDEADKLPRVLGAELALPVLVGPDARLPDTITVGCREAELATASYAYGRSTVRLAIVRESASPAAKADPGG